MDIIVTRSRIAGTLPFYEYRALVPADAADAGRRRTVNAVQAPRVAGRIACIRIAQIIAPDRYFLPGNGASPETTAAIGRLAKQVETLVVKTVFPEMTADLVPVVFPNQNDSGDSCVWTSVDDLIGAFDRLAHLTRALATSDIGLTDEGGRLAA